jgi:hypothetical protein
MGLTTPKEPTEIKKFIKDVRARLGSSTNIDWDSLAVWSFNKLPGYIWSQLEGGFEGEGNNLANFSKDIKSEDIRHN